MKYEQHIANREKQARFLAPATFIPAVSGCCKPEFINQPGGAGEQDKTKGRRNAGRVRSRAESTLECIA